MRAADLIEENKSFSEAAWNDVIQAVEGTYSELVNYQEQLEAQNAELEDLRLFMNSVFSSVSDVLVVVDDQHNIMRIGGAVVEVLGRNHHAELGENVCGIATESDREKLSKAINRVIETRQSAGIEIEAITETGSTPLDLSLGPRLDERGRGRGAVLVGRPIGELRKAYSDLEDSMKALTAAQSLLVRNEKLASLGRLVAGVAHELNNPISFVYANTHALEKYTRQVETYFEAVESGASRNELITMRSDLKLDRALKNLRSAIDGAKDGAERVRDIVEDLRRLSSEGTGEVVGFDLATTARTAADWVLKGTKSAPQISFDFDGNPRALGNPGHVQQIIMNLVQNALDAVSVEDSPALTLRIFKRKEFAVLQVEDNGPGMTQDIAQSVFDPFFTTKPVGKGTGLGLSISHKIAEEHGGSLSLIAADPGRTCFELGLPLDEPE